jgi:hypothetical protein
MNQEGPGSVERQILKRGQLPDKKPMDILIHRLPGPRTRRLIGLLHPTLPVPHERAASALELSVQHEFAAIDLQSPGFGHQPHALQREPMLAYATGLHPDWDGEFGTP